MWSRKVLAWEVTDWEDSQIAAELVRRACLREQISKRRRQPLTLHADNGKAMRAATLEARPEELGVLRSFSRPRVSNDNPFSVPALVVPCRVREESTRPPEILFCGLNPSQETKCLALGQRVMSSPHSLINEITVAGPRPGRLTRSLPATDVIRA